jgi:hypothetical protein
MIVPVHVVLWLERVILYLLSFEVLQSIAWLKRMFYKHMHVHI